MRATTVKFVFGTRTVAIQYDSSTLPYLPRIGEKVLFQSGEIYRVTEIAHDYLDQYVIIEVESC